MFVADMHRDENLYGKVLNLFVMLVETKESLPRPCLQASQIGINSSHGEC
jgi:hypothetical protein